MLPMVPPAPREPATLASLHVAGSGSATILVGGPLAAATKPTLTENERQELRQQITSLERMRVEAAVLKDVALIKKFESDIAARKRKLQDSKPLFAQIRILTQAREKSRQTLVSLDFEIAELKSKRLECGQKYKQQSLELRELSEESKQCVVVGRGIDIDLAETFTITSASEEDLEDMRDVDMGDVEVEPRDAVRHGALEEATSDP